MKKEEVIEISNNLFNYIIPDKFSEYLNKIDSLNKIFGDNKKLELEIKNI